MTISTFYFNTDLVDRVWFNGNNLDYLFFNSNQVFRKTVPAGSQQWDYTGSGANWNIPEGVSQITVCCAGAGGGGGAGRGGGGGGAGAVQAARTVTPLQLISIYCGRGGDGSVKWNVRGQNGEASTVVGTAFSSVFGFGGQGGLTDTTANGGSGGGAGGDGNPPTAGGNFSGCGGSYTGGAGGTLSGGGGGAGGFGDGQDAYNNEPQTCMPRANVTAGGGGNQFGETVHYGYCGGDGGHGRVVISWLEQ